MRLLAAALAVSALGCSGSNQVASEYVKSSEVSASRGATLSVDEADSSDLAGASLKVSPNALDSDTTIHLSLGKKNLNDADQTVAGPVAIWAPANTTFNQPAVMTLPISAANASVLSLEIAVELADKTRTAFAPTSITVEDSRTIATFETQGLGSFQAVSARACSLDDAGISNVCHNGKVCIDGFCRAQGATDAGVTDGGNNPPKDGGEGPSDGGVGQPSDGGVTGPNDGGVSNPFDGGVRQPFDGGTGHTDGGATKHDGG